MKKTNQKLLSRWREATSEIRCRMVEALARQGHHFQLATIAVSTSPHLR